MTKVPVTAIIPCYNSEGTLERAVRSVVAQTWRPLELIIIDDASRDGTVALATKLRAELGEWIQVIANPTNVGASDSRNKAWDMASHPYVAFLDSDDSWHPSKIQIQYDYMEKNPGLKITGHNVSIVNANEEIAHNLPEEFEVTQFSAARILRKNYFVTPSFMIRNDTTLRFLSGRRHMEDHLLLQEAAFRFGPIHRIELPLALLYKHIWEGGLGSSFWSMEKGEIHNFWLLRTKGYISLFAAAELTVFSLLKFCRRLLLHFRRKLRKFYVFAPR